jgi:purine-nucleoside phosphorylase
MTSSALDDPLAIRDRAVDYLKRRCDIVPGTAIILGSGLGGVADQIQQATATPFAEIPGFVRATAGGHRGELIMGVLAGQPVVAMAGRLHRYEGWTNDEIVFPVHVMAALGAVNLIVSNAAGGVNPKLRVGDLVIIRDHINWIGGCFRDFPTADGPLTRQAEIYDDHWSAVAMRAAIEGRFTALPGTYLATLGPNYETRSEYRMMRRIGADVVGMSTVIEVLAATSLKMRILGLSMVSNVANPDQATSTNHAEVLAAGRDAEVKMEQVVRAVLTDRGTTCG